MPNQKIFCSVPWHNTHLYWDGSYGMCCIETREENQKTHNIKETNLSEWHNSSTAKDFRKRILGDQPLPECRNCYKEEQHGLESRRIRENFKVAIFTEQSFDQSFEQSHWKEQFSTSESNLPIDWHIDFGNECNLACKMCHPGASSKIANLYNQWDIKYTKKPNWINDEQSWRQFLSNIEMVPNLHRLHIMGGEPTVNKKFHSFIDWLINNNLTNFGFSFATNGAKLDSKLLDKLKNFREVDIEISVESTGPTNDYVRQGGNYIDTWNTIELLAKQQTENFKVVLRSVPQLLTINTYHKYIEKALELNLSIQGIPCIWPEHLAVSVLPWEIRQNIKQDFVKLEKKLDVDDNLVTIATGRDTSRLGHQLLRECRSMISLLDVKTPKNANNLRRTLIEWLIRWDKNFNLDARDYYPEYTEFLEAYGYTV